jgi:hypothetical protein
MARTLQSIRRGISSSSSSTQHPSLPSFQIRCLPIACCTSPPLSLRSATYRNLKVLHHILYTDSSRARFEFVCLRDRTSRVTGNDQSTDSLVEKLSFFPNRYCVGALNSRGHRTGILVIRACNHHFCYLRFRDLVRSRANKETTRCILTTRAAEEKGSANSRWGHALIDRDSVRTG